MKNDKLLYGQKLLKIPILQDGTLCNISSWSNISDVYITALDKIADGIQAILIGRSYTIYLRGSLAYGGFIPGISDVDIIIIVPKKLDEDDKQLARFAAECSRKSQDWCSMVDIAIYTPEEVMQLQNNRLYMNITLTGIIMHIHGFTPNFPMPVLSKELKERIIRQTLRDCHQTLNVIRKHQLVFYMGEKRGADFLCVWFMRDILRGTIAFVMEEQQCFSLHVQTCATLFSQQYPEYIELTERLSHAECNPLDNWIELESLASEALDTYITLATQSGFI